VPDRLAQDSGDHACRRAFHQLHPERAADAVAKEKELADAEMVHHAELVVGEGVPRIVERNRAGRLAVGGVALVTRKSFLNSSMMLITAVGQLLMREFRPPPGVASSGKPEPISA
jgi:hypothetical protein